MSTPPVNPFDEALAGFQQHFEEVPVEQKRPDTEEVQVSEEESQAPEPELEAPETPTPEAEAEPEPTPEEDLEAGPEAETAESEEQEVIRGEADLAKAFGVEVQDLRENFNVQIGEESVPLSDVIERASQAPVPAQVAEMLAQQNQTITQKAQQWEQEHQSQQAVSIGVIQHFLSQLEGDSGLSDAALAALKAEDPEAWAVKSEEKRQFYGAIDASIRSAREAQEKFEAQQNEILQQRYAEEGAKLLQHVPEWNTDPELAQREAPAIAAHVQKKYGWTDEEMAQMPDHRLGLLMRNDYLNDLKEAKAKEIRKTLDAKKLTAARTVTPTKARRPRTDPAATHRAALRKRQHETENDPNRQDEYLDAVAEELSGFLTTE